MRKAEYAALRRRFGYRCGYCGVHEMDVGAELTVDHYQPRSRGGAETEENWIYCCHACNEHKQDYWRPDSPRRILHPLQDDITEHITEKTDGMLLAQSETGAFHIQRLHLNRPQLVMQRLRRQRAEEDKRNRERMLSHLSLLTQLMSQMGVSEDDTFPS